MAFNIFPLVNSRSSSNTLQTESLRGTGRASLHYTGRASLHDTGRSSPTGRSKASPDGRHNSNDRHSSKTKKFTPTYVPLSSASKPVSLPKNPTATGSAKSKSSFLSSASKSDPSSECLVMLTFPQGVGVRVKVEAVVDLQSPRIAA